MVSCKLCGREIGEGMAICERCAREYEKGMKVSEEKPYYEIEKEDFRNIRVSMLAEDLKKAQTLKERKQVLMTFDKEMEMVGPEGKKNRQWYEEGLRDYIRRKNEWFILTIERAKKNPELYVKSAEEIEKEYRAYQLDLEKNKSFGNWDLGTKLVKAKNQFDRVIAMYGEKKRK